MATAADTGLKQATAQLRYLRIAPRKVRAVIDLVRGMKVEKALQMLEFVEKRASIPVKKLIQSAVANAQVKSIDVDTLVVSDIQCNQGPTMRRFMPRAMGRAFRINKKTSHITLILAPPAPKKAPVSKTMAKKRAKRAAAAKPAAAAAKA